MKTEKGPGGISGNQIKIIALLAMTCDHVGKQLLPELMILQIIGRLAFPLFAYMIAEGCIYTKNRKKYLAKMIMVALLCQVVYYVFVGSLYQCILVTFSLSVILIYLLDWGLQRKTWWSIAAVVSAVAIVYGICEGLPRLLQDTDFCIDYGFAGVIFPVLVYSSERLMCKREGSSEQAHQRTKEWLVLHRLPNLLVTMVMLIVLAWNMGGLQWYALAALPVLAFYDGSRGRWRMKSFFYFYYPIHLAIIYGISVLLSVWK